MPQTALECLSAPKQTGAVSRHSWQHDVVTVAVDAAQHSTIRRARSASHQRAAAFGRDMA
jgi:hypothetical protein